MSNAKVKVFIDGAEGTTGLRLLDRLSGRSDIELLSIAPELRKDEAERAKISNSADIVFLCLPDEAAKKAVRNITNPATRVIDASTAHRTNKDWAYGLPELSGAHRKAVINSSRVGVPGCHATGFILLAYPIVSEGIVKPDYPFVCHSVTGYSGGGKSKIAQYEEENRSAAYQAPAQYALAQKHKHLPEMQIISGIDFPPLFNPIIADFYAGMVTTIPLHARLMAKRMSAKELHAFYVDYYKGQKAVKVMDFGAEASFENAVIEAGALAGLDTLEIFVCGHDDQAVIISRFDNLGKGSSGGAIQCMNIMCGFDEMEGLAK